MVLPELERGATDKAGLGRLQARLSAGPWCWPSSEDVRAFELAVRATGLLSPPPPRVATTVGVTVDGVCGFLWMIDGSSESRAITDADLGDTSRHSWSTAALALPRSVPLLWTSVSSAHSHAPCLLRLGTFLSGPGIEPTCQVVRGPSFGLAFLLVLASRVFNVALPGDVIASAAIAEDGRVDGVEGLSTKIGAIVERMPQVRRLIVAAVQEEEARGLAGGRLEVIGARSASQVLDIVFGERLAGLLLEEGTSAKRRHELAEWFFCFSLVGRGELVDWSPVAAAAKRALETWPDVSEDQKFKLSFARGVAERHEWNTGTLPVPTVDWLLAQPATLRTQVVAHLVQQIADVWQPSLSEVEPLLQLVRQPNVRDAHPMQLRIEGALARLLAVTGLGPDALIRQEQLANVYFDSLLFGEVSFPLAEWFRLSGALGDASAFERAEQMHAAVNTTGGFGLAGSLYVDLARCRAMSLIRTRIDGDVIAMLRKMAATTRGPEHIRWAAVRVLLRQPESLLDGGYRSTIQAALDEAALDDIHRGRAAAINRVLARLDAALLMNKTTEAVQALSGLRVLEPSIVNYLEKAATGTEVAAYVATYYPY